MDGRRPPKKKDNIPHMVYLGQLTRATDVHLKLAAAAAQDLAGLAVVLLLRQRAGRGVRPNLIVGGHFGSGEGDLGMGVWRVHFGASGQKEERSSWSKSRGESKVKTVTKTGRIQTFSNARSWEMPANYARNSAWLQANCHTEWIYNQHSLRRNNARSQSS